MARFERILLVPTGLAIDGPWDLDIPCVGLSSIHEVFPFTDLNDLPLVSLPEGRAALLAPKGAKLNGLTPFSERLLRADQNVWAWKDDDPVPRTLSGASRGNARDDLVRLLLPHPDKLVDSWPELSFSSGINRSKYTAAAQEQFMGTAPIEYPEGLVTVILEDDLFGWT